MTRILLVAAENGAIPGAKVGGMGDVIRDLPPALAEAGSDAQVVMPGYGCLARKTGAQWQQSLSVPFGGKSETVELSVLTDEQEMKTWLLDHPLFYQGGEGVIYSQDDPYRPFAGDAHKFALFCAAVAQGMICGAIDWPDVLHLHDWHAALVALLRQYDPLYQQLKELPCVYTIHNLSLQGIRPLQHDSSALAAWFPELFHLMTSDQLASVADPRYGNCMNPMRVGIVLSDRVHLVSPSYAEEVMHSSLPNQGFFGGEGLEYDLRVKAREGNLVGILNGCVYQDKSSVSGEFSELLEAAENAVLGWMGTQASVATVHQIALTRIQQLWRKLVCNQAPDIVLTSIGRLTDQKVLILRQRQRQPDGRILLESMLCRLKQERPRAVMIVLGSGDPEISREFREVAGRQDNLLFLNGYNEELSSRIYAQGDLFLMPSSFEPCGISQMLAMRAGQLCLVHGIGGLKDTVEEGKTGFVFSGENLAEQGVSLERVLERALSSFGTELWQRMRQNAYKQRFEWSTVVERYLSELYQIPQSVQVLHC